MDNKTGKLPFLISEEDLMGFCPAFRFMKQGETVSNLQWEKTGTVAKVKNGGLFLITGAEWTRWSVDNKQMFSEEYYIVEQ